MTKKIFITGGAGFIGSHLVQRFSDKNFEVHILVRKNTSLDRLDPFKTHNNIFIHIGELNNQIFLNKIIGKIKPDFVFHLAASGAYHWQNDPENIFKTNVLGSHFLFEALNQLSDFPLIINVGSSSEYGRQSHSFKETDLVKPMSYYAISKVAQTHLAQYQTKVSNLPIITVRLFTIYGPGEDSRKLIPTIINKSLTNQPITLADPNIAHDYVYVEDVLDSFEILLSFPQYSGEVFNIGSGHQTTLKKLIEIAEKSWSTPLTTSWGEYPSHRWDIEHWVSNQDKTFKMIGWEATTSLGSGLKKTMEWYKTHR